MQALYSAEEAEFLKERLELSNGRIKEIAEEGELQEPFAGYFKDTALFIQNPGYEYGSVEKYENRMDSFNSKDDVFTFLIHLGYLAYDADNAQCYIPNREIHNEWQNAISDNVEYAETNKIISQSKILLEKTLQGNENSEKIQALVNAITSDAVQKYIDDTYKGAVITSFVDPQ